MESPNPAQSNSPSEQSRGPLRTSLAEAVRYWEPRRLSYNLALVAVCLAWVLATWPHFRPALTLSELPSFLPLAVLALLANACYCAAYLVDVPLQLSPARSFWRRGRWALWSLGTLVAIVLANYWIGDEIYPFVR